MGILQVVVMGLALVVASSEAALANYLICLKNSRCITATSYREEGEKLWFSNSLGKIALPKDQVQSITHSESPKVPSTSDGAQVGSGTAAMSAQGEATEMKEYAGAGVTPPTAEPSLTPEQRLAEERAREEKEYQKRVAELTGEIKSLTNRYMLAVTGSTGDAVCVTGCTNFIESKSADLKSRWKDTLHDPAKARGTDVLRMETPSSFAGAPPNTLVFRPTTVKSPQMVRVPLPTYTPQEKQLSEMRNKLGRLSDERDRLIREMQAKGFDTGSLFLE